MRKKNLPLLRYFTVVTFILLSISGCQMFKVKKVSKSGFDPSGKRDIAQASHYHNPKHINTYNTLMNHPLYKTQPETGESIENFIPRIKAMVTRQFDMIYIGQFLLHDFDAELNRLTKIKSSGRILSDDDYAKLNMIYFKLKIAWILADRNKDELSDLYLLTLEDRNMLDSKPDPERLIRVKLILSQIPVWLEEATSKGYILGVLPLAQELSAINRAFIERSPEGKNYVIDVERFLSVSNAERAKSFEFSKNPEIRKKFETVSDFIEETATKQYEKLFNEFENKPDDLGEPLVQTTRLPSAAIDNLEPSSGGTGHMSGNKVPENTWTLTFDDGPHATHTEGMFKVLSQHHVPGTFFWLSKNMKTNQSLVEKAKSLGFPRGSHSMTHANLPKVNLDGLKFEITQAAEVFNTIVGRRPTLFRCPYGACGPMGSPIRQVIAENNMLHIAWNVDTLDWQDKNPQSIFERTRKQMELRGKGIVLFHDVHQQSVDALKLLIPWMKSKKYKIDSLPKMISDTRGTAFESP